MRRLFEGSVSVSCHTVVDCGDLTAEDREAVGLAEADVEAEDFALTDAQALKIARDRADRLVGDVPLAGLADDVEVWIIECGDGEIQGIREVK